MKSLPRVTRFSREDDEGESVTLEFAISRLEPAWYILGTVAQLIKSWPPATSANGFDLQTCSFIYHFSFQRYKASGPWADCIQPGEFDGLSLPEVETALRAKFPSAFVYRGGQHVDVHERDGSARVLIIQ
jgi:hypothetical protein